MSNGRTPRDDEFSRRIDRAHDAMIADQYNRMHEQEDREIDRLRSENEELRQRTADMARATSAIVDNAGDVFIDLTDNTEHYRICATKVDALRAALTPSPSNQPPKP